MPSIFDVVRSFVVDTVNAIPANLLTAIDPTATPSADPVADAAAAGAAIRAAIGDGYTLQTFTASDPFWGVPPELANAVEAHAFVIGGGGRGLPGINGNTTTGGAGGSSGGFTAIKFDPALLGSTLGITIGAAASTFGADGTSTVIVDNDTSNPIIFSLVNVGAIASIQGFVESTSRPGRGGAGGGSSTTSTAGESNGFTDGGDPVAATSGTGTGTAGYPGGDGQTTDIPLAGGAGGAGGGGRNGGTPTGGDGGNGGFPGAGSGGGGSATGTSPTSGSPGIPGNGFAALLWK